MSFSYDMKVTDTIKYVGVNDHEVDLFEGQFEVPLGMAYNSYVILDEQIAVMDSVDTHFGAQWIKNIERVIGDKTPAYLVVHHMEMDHSANIKLFMDKYPSAKIVASKMAFTMLKNCFGTDFAGRNVVAGEGTQLALGKHTLNFITAANVHWPEVLMSYESSEKVLFTADGFGKFGANDVEDPEGWACEARRYYFGIVGKFGPNVQAVLAKLADKPIEKICSLHGPAIVGEIDSYINYYKIWSNYDVESEGVMIAYTSVYGNTKTAVIKLAEILKARGVKRVVLADLAREDTYECVENAFRYGKLVLATTTYNAGVFPKMRDFINLLLDRNYQKRTVAFVENGTWAPAAAKCMANMFEGSKDLKIVPTKVSIKIALKDENVAQMEKMVDELLA